TLSRSRRSATGLVPARALSIESRARCRATSTFGIRATAPRVSITNLPRTRYIATQERAFFFGQAQSKTRQMPIRVNNPSGGWRAQFTDRSLREANSRHKQVLRRAAYGLARG